MPRADYWGIEQELAEILRANVQGLTVEVEAEMQFGAELSPWAVVYLERRDAPDGLQGISAGMRTCFRLRFSIWVWCCSLEKEAAIKQRDETLAEVERVLMRNRTLNNTVDSSWLDGGELQTGKTQESDFLSGGEVVLIADIVSSVT